ncbi:MAG: DUF3169 family protein [Oscillospiraceae bacterium]|nr:DUF3169 family protein [Oscillospiraceae bacterium]
MKDNNDAIRQENKKALPKFIGLMALSLVFGLALGIGLVFLSFGSFGDALAAAGLFFTQKIAGWLLFVFPVVTLAVCLPIYFGAKKQIAAWDGEDEAVSSEVETKLSVCIWITSMELIASFFLLAALISGFTKNVGTEQEIAPAMFWGGLAAFLVGGLALSTIFQQKLVDLTKRLYPEKQGSVYDTKFQKKWYQSCDEAERLVIGQCAFKAYQAMCRTCMALWAVFGLGGMFFDWSFLPAMVACIIWGVGQSVYSWTCLRLSKPGSPSVY